MGKSGRSLRVLLVKPPVELPTIRALERLQRLEPLELSYLAGALPRHHAVNGLDLRLSRRPWRTFVHELNTFQPHLVGITAFFHEYRQALALARLVKKTLPDVTVVVGGHHATASPESFNDPSAVDWVVRGEGCGPFSQLVAALAAGELPEPSPALLSHRRSLPRARPVSLAGFSPGHPAAPFPP